MEAGQNVLAVNEKKGWQCRFPRGICLTRSDEWEWFKAHVVRFNANGEKGQNYFRVVFRVGMTGLNNRNKFKAQTVKQKNNSKLHRRVVYFDSRVIFADFRVPVSLTPISPYRSRETNFPF